MEFFYINYTFVFYPWIVSYCYHSEVAAVSGLEWAVQAAAMEVVVPALVAEVVGVLPELELLKTQSHQDLERQFSTHRLLGHNFHIHTVTCMY